MTVIIELVLVMWTSFGEIWKCYSISSQKWATRLSPNGWCSCEGMRANNLIFEHSVFRAEYSNRNLLFEYLFQWANVTVFLHLNLLKVMIWYISLHHLKWSNIKHLSICNLIAFRCNSHVLIMYERCHENAGFYVNPK